MYASDRLLHRRERVSAIDLSSDVGLVACGLLTLNIVLGLLLSMRYNPWTHWPHHRFNYFRVHNWTGYLALAVSALHPVIVLFSATANFRVVDVVAPVQSPKQPLVNSLGAVGLYALALVVVTSYFRHRMTRHTWKLLHYTAYVSAAFFLAHSLFSDPTLKGQPVDWLDGEKVYIELCALVVLAVSGYRVRWAVQRARRRSLGRSPVRAAARVPAGGAEAS